MYHIIKFVKTHKAAEWQLLGSCNRLMVIPRKTCLENVSESLRTPFKAVTYNSD